MIQFFICSMFFMFFQGPAGRNPFRTGAASADGGEEGECEDLDGWQGQGQGQGQEAPQSSSPEASGGAAVDAAAETEAVKVGRGDRAHCLRVGCILKYTWRIFPASLANTKCFGASPDSHSKSLTLSFSLCKVRVRFCARFCYRFGIAPQIVSCCRSGQLCCGKYEDEIWGTCRQSSASARSRSRSPCPITCWHDTGGTKGHVMIHTTRRRSLKALHLPLAEFFLFIFSLRAGGILGPCGRGRHAFAAERFIFFSNLLGSVCVFLACLSPPPPTVSPWPWVSLFRRPAPAAQAAAEEGADGGGAAEGEEGREGEGDGSGDQERGRKRDMYKIRSLLLQVRAVSWWRRERGPGCGAPEILPFGGVRSGFVCVFTLCLCQNQRVMRSVGVKSRDASRPRTRKFS